MAATNESEQQAASGAGEPTTPTGPATSCPPVATLDPQLLMAARRGDIKQLKDLLLLKDGDEQQGSSSVTAGAQDAIVEVDPRPPPPHDAVAPPSSGSSSPPPPVPVVLDEDGVTMDGDSLLHVVAACGDTQQYLDCAKMMVRNKKHKAGGGADAVRLALEARNLKGDTPLHCAAGAGNANMIGCLLTDLIANTSGDEAVAAVKKAFLIRMQNEVGETALHQAVRAANNKVACIDQLMAMDPLTTAAAAADARPVATLDPRLLMAARRGDSKALKDLLQLNDDDGNDDQQGEDTRADDEGSGTPTTDSAASRTTSVEAAPSISPPDHIVDVDPRRPDAVAAHLPPPPPVPVLDEDGVTTEEGSLLVHSEIVEQVVVEPPPPHDNVAPPARQPPAAAPAGSFPAAVPVLDEDGVTMEGDSLLHVVAACGDTQEFLDCVDVIVRNKEKKSGAGGKRRALEARNNKGDTPLHCAAGAGNAHMISCLVGLLANTADDDNDNDEAGAAVKKAFLRLQNECGDTALHQAVRAARNNVACIDHLMDVDPELACLPFPHQEEEEDAGASPLYLAISLGEIEIAQHLYVKSKGKLSYLHAAVHRGQAAALPMVLKWLIKKDPKAMADDMQQQQRAEGQGRAHLHLLSQLTRQRDKENGSTPLHLAAGRGGLPSPRMSKTHPYFWGCLRVVKALLWRCRDCATLRDAKGRTFLHIAVEEGRYNVVRYVRQQSQGSRRHKSLADAAVARVLSSILNAQDINGDTALHHAVHAGNWAVFFCLARNQRVRLDVQNKEGMTPIDVAWREMPLKVYYAWDSRIHIRKYLLIVGAPYGENRGDLFHQKHILPKQDEDKMSANLTAAAQVLGLFSVLMTTVTFASAFTLPGGYRSAGDGGGGVAGTPVLAGPRRSYAFDAFVLSNALAFLCSLYATSLLLYAGVPYGTLTGRFATINHAYTLMWHAGRSLLAAFALGLYVVLFPVARTIAIVVLVLAGIVAVGFVKDSEGIRSMIVIGRSRRMPSIWDVLLHWIIYALDRFWSYIIIFGLPAIHK
ncbi:unnamed protein product [Miscanthus lutarioriparius]|uniref:PGG domain-containing protein n=1 Tax=Miscanthus lutarioriparius TaxID=422564 RepID=A0A811SEI3_9POAL|nr:unnamed protein product [Miscanthus lutarioriparius]